MREARTEPRYGVGIVYHYWIDRATDGERTPSRSRHRRDTPKKSQITPFVSDPFHARTLPQAQAKR